MNTRNLQIHLEKKLSDLASVCMEQGTSDDGLIFEILSAESLNDETRLNYIGQIDCRLPASARKSRRIEVDLNSLYPEEDEIRTEKQHRWNHLHKIAVEMSSGHSEAYEIPKERFFQLVSVLRHDPNNSKQL